MKYLKFISIFLISINCFATGEQAIIDSIAELRQAVENLKPAPKTYTDYITDHWKPIAFAVCVGGTCMALYKYGPATTKNLKNLFLNPLNDYIKSKINFTAKKLRDSKNNTNQRFTAYEESAKKIEQRTEKFADDFNKNCQVLDSEIEKIDTNVNETMLNIYEQITTVQNSGNKICKKTKDIAELVKKTNIFKLHNQVQYQINNHNKLIEKNKNEINTMANALITKQTNCFDVIGERLGNIQKQMNISTDNVIPNIVATVSDIEQKLKILDTDSTLQNKKQELRNAIATLFNLVETTDNRQSKLVNDLFEINDQLNKLVAEKFNINLSGTPNAQ